MNKKVEQTLGYDMEYLEYMSCKNEAHIQGDSLSCFCVHYNCKSFFSMVSDVIWSDCFKDYTVNDDKQNHILQYENDIVLMGNGMCESLWSLEYSKALRYQIAWDQAWRLFYGGNKYFSCYCIDSFPFHF